MSRPVMNGEQIEEAIRQYRQRLRSEITQQRRYRIARSRDMPDVSEPGQPRQTFHRESINQIEDDIAELRRRVPQQVRDYQRYLRENAHHPDNARADRDALQRSMATFRSPFHPFGAPGSAEYQQAMGPRGPAPTPMGLSPITGSPAPSVSSRMTAEQPPLVGYTYANDTGRPVSPFSLGEGRGKNRKGKGIGFSKSKKIITTENPVAELPREISSRSIRVESLPSSRAMRVSVSEGERPKSIKPTFMESAKKSVRRIAGIEPSRITTSRIASPEQAIEFEALNPVGVVRKTILQGPVQAKTSSKRGLLQRAKEMSKRTLGIKDVVEAVPQSSPTRISKSESPKAQTADAFAIPKGKGKNKDKLHSEVVKVLAESPLDERDYEWLDATIGPIIKSGKDRIIEIEKGEDWATSSRANKTIQKKRVIDEVVEQAREAVQGRLNGRGKSQTVKMTKKVYMAEHKKLIKLLNDMSAKTKAEANKQTAEVKEQVKRGRGRPKKCVNNVEGGCGTCGGM